MSLPTRVGLAMALAWAGGFGLPGPPAAKLPLLVIVVVAAWWLGPAQERRDSKSAQWAAMVALAVVLGLLARTLGRVLIATPAALWSLPIAGLALLIGGRSRALAFLLTGLALAAALLGARFEAAGSHSQGRVYSTPIIGVHPRQAIAVRLDGFGPHDIIADDYVDPPGGQGYDPTRWAARLEAELHAIADQNYAEGPARARAAFADARVVVREALVPPAERELYPSLLGVEVRSGTHGEGSTVEFVCPGQALGPPSGSGTHSTERACPRKYLVDGSTGLGLASRWPGHTQVIGRDRARLARALGWPSGDPRHDRRLLALESGAWLLALALVAWWLGRRRELEELGRAAAIVIGSASAGLLVLALLADATAWAADQPGVWAGRGVDRGGPTLLAVLLVLIPKRTEAARSDAPREPEPAALPCALLLALLAVAPLAGRGDALELVAITRGLLIDLGLDWSLSSALAGSLAAVALTIGAGISAAMLLDRSRSPGLRERRHVWIGLALVLVCGVSLALRKPADDLALLQSAAALLVLACFRLRAPARQVVLTLLCAAAATAPILDGDARSPVALGFAGLAALLCLVLGRGSRPAFLGGSPPDGGPPAGSASHG